MTNLSLFGLLTFILIALYSFNSVVIYDDHLDQKLKVIEADLLCTNRYGNSLLQQVENNAERYLTYTQDEYIISEENADDIRLIAITAEAIKDHPIRIYITPLEANSKRAIDIRKQLQYFGISGDRITIISDKHFPMASDTTIMLTCHNEDFKYKSTSDISFSHP